MSVKKKRTIGPCRGVTWLYYVVLLWSRDFFLSLYLDPRFRPLLLKFSISLGNFIYLNIYIYICSTMVHYVHVIDTWLDSSQCSQIMPKLSDALTFASLASDALRCGV